MATDRAQQRALLAAFRQHFSEQQGREIAHIDDEDVAGYSRAVHQWSDFWTGGGAGLTAHSAGRERRPERVDRRLTPRARPQDGWRCDEQRDADGDERAREQPRLRQGSLLVVFVFLLDAFAGPGMTGGSAPPWAVSQKAADILIAAGMGMASPAGDWVKVALVTGGALAAAFFVFVASARSRA